MPAKSSVPGDPALQQDLFGDAPPVSAGAHLVQRTQVVARTPPQKRFSKLLLDIEKANLRMRNVSELLETGRRGFTMNVEPLHRAFDDARRVLALEMAKRLATKTKYKGFTAPMRRFATDFLDDFLPYEEAQSDAELQPLYETIFGPLEQTDWPDDRDELDDEIDAAARDTLRAMGFPDHLIDEALRDADDDDSQAARGAVPESEPTRSAREKKRAPGKRQLADEQSAESAKVALRTLYRQLASNLHPDRARDAAALALATDRMARANVAYAANDLQGLLALQLETARESDQYLIKETDETVRAWCSALEAQLVEIKASTRQLENALRMALGGGVIAIRLSGVKVADVERAVNAATLDARRDLDEITSDIEAVRDDARFVGWLRDLQVELKRRSVGRADPFGDDFTEEFTNMVFEKMIRQAMHTQGGAPGAAPTRQPKRKARR